MANINLLPWREERREEKQKEFIAIMGFVAAISFLAIWLVNGVFDDALSAQQQRNAFLKREMSVIEAQISEIQELREKKKQLLDRMELIQALQGNRPIIARVFDEFVKTLPDDVYFSNMNVKGNLISIKGKAASNNRVAALMRSLNQSKWFSDPELISVKAAKKNEYNSFEIALKQQDPKKLNDEGNENE